MSGSLQFVLCTLCLAWPAAAQTADRSPVEVVTAFHEALVAKDSALALSLLAPGVVIYEAGRVDASREAYRQGHLPGDVRFASAVTREVINRQSGSVGELAWILTETRTTGTFRERDIASFGTETVLLRRTSEGWRIVHIHWSSRSRSKSH